jgi:hypothetical protein
VILGLPAPEKVGASNLPPDDEKQAIQDGTEAADTFVQYHRESFDLTLRIGRALEILSKRALIESRSVKEAGPAYRVTIAEALNRFGLDRINKSERSRMREVYRNRIAINAWRDKLDAAKRDSLTSAKAILAGFKKHERDERGEITERSTQAEQIRQLKAKIEKLQQQFDRASEDGGNLITEDTAAGDLVDWMARVFSLGKLQDISTRLRKAIAAKKGEPPKPTSPRFRKQS